MSSQEISSYCFLLKMLLRLNLNLLFSPNLKGSRICYNANSTLLKKNRLVNNENRKSKRKQKKNLKRKQEEDVAREKVSPKKRDTKVEYKKKYLLI